jgi:hypothetical protein
MPQRRKYKTREQHLEERRQYWQTYYPKNRESILEKHRAGGIYAKTNNNIEYTGSSMNTLEKPLKERTRKPPKTPLQRKRERIARDLEEVERKASAFREKLSQQKVNEENIESIETPIEP